MCGVVAIVGASGPVARERLERARSALRHRGPDGQGAWLGEGVGLAHVRLAIVDPDGGAQPIASEDGAIVVAASGEIYEHERLRRELEARGHRFRSRSDSELLVHLYEEHGPRCVEHVHGELAFVLWDASRRRLVAGRDRFGVRPLVWAEHEGMILVASEAKALFAAGVPARWDEDALLFAASLQYTPPDRTLFYGVRTLPPGAVLVVEDGRARVVRYWELDYPRRPARERERDGVEASASVHAANEVRAHLEEAVRVRVAGETPACFQLSGGLDSTAVLALGARALGRRVDAFTLTFDDPAYDERATARASAAELGADLHEVDAGEDALVDALPAAVAQGEGLAINAHIGAKWLLSRAIHQAGYKVALSGEGSDEVFAGYAHLRRDAGVSDVSTTNGVSLGTMLPDGDAAPLPLEAVSRALGFVPSFLEAKASLGRRVHGLLHPRAAPDAFAAMIDGFDVRGQLEGRAKIHASLHLWTRLALATYILRTLGDGMDMAHAVEVRLPFLDTRVFEHARDLPVELLVKDGVEKHVLREALRGVVPEPVRRREKHPLLAPAIATAPARRARELAGDVLCEPGVPLFDGKAVAALFDRVPAMSARERLVTEPVLMMVLTASLLGRTYRLS